MSSALTQSELFALLADGQTVLVPHPHAARTLRARFQQQANEAPTGADAGSLLAWTEWTSSLWSNLVVEGVDDRVLLNRAQEDLLWSTIFAARPAISGSGSASSSASAPAQAQLARSGLRLAAAYNATDRLRSAADTSDARTFASWVEAFRDQCDRHHLLAPALLDKELVRHIRSAVLPVPSVLHLVGFENLSPAQRDLISALEAAGASVRMAALRHNRLDQAENLLITTPDPREQLRFAARWVADQAALAPTGVSRTFALVTPRPDDHRAELERFLREALTPELEPVTADLSSTPWQFAARPPLSSARVVTDALHLLRWTAEPLAVERISQVLLSPYFLFAEDPEQRARTEARIRRELRLLRPELGLDQFLQLIASSARNPAARFPEFLALRRLLEPRSSRPATRLYSEWADHARSLLATLGWPGPRTLTPTEFAAVEAWEGLLDLLSTLDLTGRRILFPTFLQQLEEEVAQAAFAVPAPAAPVQILTLAEAEALPFDHVLVLDATDNHLPPPETLHPLLSRRLQRLLDMPGSDPARSYALTHSRLNGLLARSSTLLLVAPAQDATGTLRPTRLAADLQFKPLEAAALYPPSAPIPPLRTEELEEVTPLPPLASPVAHGGARLLELQSACGFRAFADLRLRAEEPASPALGLNPREAGSRLHEALQKLWAELRDQATLRSLASQDRNAIVRHAVAAALDPLARTPGAERPWPQAFMRILEDRFVRLLDRWLDLELSRAPFTPLAQEQGRQITLGPLQFNIRPDRIDQVADGLVFIDYKTAYTLSTDQWLGERPDAPQLPLYTLLEEPENVRGLAFAQVRPGKDMGWHSLSDTEGLFPRNSDNTQSLIADQIELWREELTRLAYAFANGDASVNPKNYPGTCEYCAQRLLCRLDPTTLLAQTIDDDEEEDELEENPHG